MNLIAGRKVKPVSIRMPDAVREALDEAAAQNGRTRNGEAVVRLAESLGVKPSKKKQQK